MYLAYISRTSNILKIVEKLGLPQNRIIDIESNPNLELDRKYCVLTYTDFLGQIPEIVKFFVHKNKDNLCAIAGSGNRNFGKNFCGAAKKLREIYDPLHKMPYFEFELKGDEDSIRKFREFLNS